MGFSSSPILQAATAALVLAAAPRSPAGAAGPKAVDRDSLRAYWTQRDRWQLPDSVIAALRITPGMIVADLGAGDGYFSQRLARAVGPTGKVLALDIDESALELNQALAREAGITNIETRVVAADDPGLVPGEADLVFISKTWHVLPDRFCYARRLSRALGPEDRVAVIGSGKESTPRATRRPGTTDRYEVQRQAEAGGFVLTAEHRFLGKQFFIELQPGEASIFRQIPAFRYITAELASGEGPPDPAALEALAERGFLEIVDLRPPGPDAGADSLRARVEELGLRYARARPDELAARIGDPDTGIAFVFGDDRQGVEAEIKALADSGRIVLTACEWDLLFGIVR